jgi:hypothetical protein
MSTTEPLVLAHVVQDVLDPFTPTVPLRITYNNRLFLAGAELKPSAVVSKPRADIGGADMRAFLHSGKLINLPMCAIKPVDVNVFVYQSKILHFPEDSLVQL